MAARLQLTLAAVLFMVAMVLAGVLLFGSDVDATDTAPGFRGFARPADIPPGDFVLNDQDGRVATLAAQRGKVVVLTFMYATCQDSCPVIASQIRGAFDAVGHDVPAFAISVDPANDTPLNARRFLLKEKVNGRMRFLLGTRRQLAPIWRAYGIRPQGKGFDHSAYVLLIDKRGRQRLSFPFEHLVPEDLAHDIARLERETR